MDLGGRRERKRFKSSAMAAALFFFACLPFFSTALPNTARSAGVSCSQAEVRGSVDGPGSFPPRCTLKCGECNPCNPVHVPVPPGHPVIAEYYPEAWRCKCGNKLFMP